jgi:hypothetical protein
MSGAALTRGGMAAFAMLLFGSGCGEPPPPAQTATPGACGADGSFKTELFGGLDAAIDWQSDQIQCQGMPRPNGAGARLRFFGQAGSGADGTPLAFIFAIPALERGKTAKELPTKVTIIDEKNSRFFATQLADACWTDIDRQQALEGGDKFAIGGILYCVSPLAELHGNTSIRLSDVRFVGLLDWTLPE